MAQHCKHTNSGIPGYLSLLTKTHIKHRKDGDHTEIEEVSHTSTSCLLCNEIYEWWISRLSLKFEGHDTVELPRFKYYGHEDDLVTSIARSPRLPFSLKPLRGQDWGRLKRKFVVEPNRFGEAHHVLICCLILRSQAVDMNEVKVLFRSREDGLQDLFEWHGISTGKALDGQKEDPMSDATEIIAAAFRDANEASEPDGEHEQGGHLRMSHHRLQSLLLKMLDSTFEWDIGRPVTSDLKQSYFEPAYAAKFWLNRYLQLTHQGRLPKSDDVTRIAVIHVRGNAGSAIGRVMDKDFLRYTAKGIAAANQCATRAGESCFTHVMLYGDFWYEEGAAFKDLVVDAIAEQAHPKSKKNEKKSGKGRGKEADSLIKVLFISRPWRLRIEDKLTRKVRYEEDPEVNVRKFWERFRDKSFDNLPAQVKVFAIWRVLRQRYSYNVCIIGHRSGFIEGAALIGIPVFYFNNERSDLPRTEAGRERQVKMEKNQSSKHTANASRKQGRSGGGTQTNIGGSQGYYHPPGEMLWRPVPGFPKRLYEISDVMNTFIPLEVLKKEYVKGEVRKRDEEFEHELTAALFMFMCCNVKVDTTMPAQPQYIQKLPGWVLRVDMMHDYCELYEHTPGQGRPEDPKHGDGVGEKEELREGIQCGDVVNVEEAKSYMRSRLDQHLSDEDQVIRALREHTRRWQQTGQEWLRRRYRFATEQDCHPDICLIGWWGLYDKVRAIDIWYPAKTLPYGSLNPLNPTRASDHCRITQYQDFCAKTPQQAWPVTLETLRTFVEHMASKTQRKQSGMWSGHVDALKSYHVRKKLPLDVFDLPYVRELKRGSSVRDGHYE